MYNRNRGEFRRVVGVALPTSGVWPRPLWRRGLALTFLTPLLLLPRCKEPPAGCPLLCCSMGEFFCSFRCCSNPVGGTCPAWGLLL